MPKKETLRRSPGKMLGDAGEHYALSQFSFAGNYAAKMPDNWEGYDLAVETGNGLKRVSVKTRSEESSSWTDYSWFTFNDTKDCDWMAFILKLKDGNVRAWIIPFSVALKHANVPGPRRKDSHLRDIPYKKLRAGGILSRYENNWALDRAPRIREIASTAR